MNANQVMFIVPLLQLPFAGVIISVGMGGSGAFDVFSSVVSNPTKLSSSCFSCSPEFGNVTHKLKVYVFPGVRLVHIV
ncbi:Uncharacterised protein [uncultured archaeon]|nr:Uncharacterised protein [uncultured archaeon]